jgi:WD40 repeat protein
MSSQKLINSFPGGNTANRTELKFLADGRLAAQNNASKIVLWNVTNGQATVTLNQDAFCLEQLVNDNLASSGSDSFVRFWNVTSGVCVAAVKASSKVTTLRQTSIVNYLAGGDIYGSIFVVDLNVYKHVLQLSGHTGTITGLVAMSNGNLISSSSDQTLRLWTLYNGACLDVINPLGIAISRIQVMTSNMIVIAASSSRKVSLVNLNSTNRLLLAKNYSLAGSYATGMSLSLSQFLLISLANGSLCYIDLNNLTMLIYLNINWTDSVRNMALSGI